MDPKTITTIQKITEDLLERVGVPADVVVEVDESAVVQITIQCDEESAARGILIGRRGETLHALQLILSLLVNRDREEWVQLTLDVDGYRQKREEQLIAMAKRIAEKVSYLKEPIALSPMPAIDRRIIHMAIADMDGVISESTGNGRERKIIVSPA